MEDPGFNPQHKRKKKNKVVMSLDFQYHDLEK